MTTVVCAVLRREFRFDMFADLVAASLVGMPARVAGSPEVALTFAGVLSSAEVDAIRGRMESTDDTDQAKRADIAALLNDPACADSPLTKALAHYILGTEPTL